MQRAPGADGRSRGVDIEEAGPPALPEHEDRRHQGQQSKTRDADNVPAPVEESKKIGVKAAEKSPGVEYPGHAQDLGRMRIDIDPDRHLLADLDNRHDGESGFYRRVDRHDHAAREP